MSGALLGYRNWKELLSAKSKVLSAKTKNAVGHPGHKRPYLRNIHANILLKNFSKSNNLINKKDNTSWSIRASSINVAVNI